MTKKLMLIPGGDQARVAALVDDTAGGKLRLPPCFNIKGATREQTVRAHTMAREMVAN